MGTVMHLPYQNNEMLELTVKGFNEDVSADAPNADVAVETWLNDEVADPVSAVFAKATEDKLKQTSPFYSPAEMTAAPALKKSIKNGMVVEMNGKQKWTYHYVGGQVVASMVQDPELDCLYFDGHGQEISADKHAKLLTELAQKDESVELAAAMPAEFQKILGLSDLEKLDF